MRISGRGFTLIELMVSVTILAIIMTAGIGLFYRSLRDSSRSDLSKILDERSRVIIGNMTRYLRESKIDTLDGQTRNDCVSAGQAVGSTLVAEDLYGMQSTFSIAAGKLASASASTIVINPETSISVGAADATPIFTWYCAGGVQDRLVMVFRLTVVGESGSGTINNDYTIDLTLRNTGQ